MLRNLALHLLALPVVSPGGDGNVGGLRMGAQPVQFLSTLTCAGFTQTAGLHTSSTGRSKEVPHLYWRLGGNGLNPRGDQVPRHVSGQTTRSASVLVPAFSVGDGAAMQPQMPSK